MHQFKSTSLTLAVLLASFMPGAQAQAYQFRVPAPLLHVEPDVTAAPAFSLSAAAIDFGTVATPATKSLSLVVANTGNVALNTPTVSASGEGFSATHNCGAILGVAATCAVTATFAPTATQAYEGSLSVVYAGLAVQRSTLGGTSVVPLTGPSLVGDGVSKSGACSTGETGCTTWNVQDGWLSVSNAGLTATCSASGWRGGRAASGKSVGKWYWEYTATQPGGGALASGIAAASVDMGAPIMAANTYAWWPASYYVDNGTFRTSLAPTAPSNFTIGVALDMDSHTVTVSQGAVTMFTAALGSQAYYPLAMCAESGVRHTANFGQSSFVYPVPSGYHAGLW